MWRLWHFQNFLEASIQQNELEFQEKLCENNKTGNVCESGDRTGKRTLFAKNDKISTIHVIVCK